jgi:hypothetical protein
MKSMPDGLNYYRLYSLDRDRKVLLSRGVAAESDRDAIEKARQMIDSGIHELWLGTKLVAQIYPLPRPMQGLKLSA